MYTSWYLNMNFLGKLIGGNYTQKLATHITLAHVKVMHRGKWSITYLDIVVNNSKSGTIMPDRFKVGSNVYNWK